MQIKPQHWFRTLNEHQELTNEPYAIEYFNIQTGETFIHIEGTVYWDNKNHCLNIASLMQNGITHWRIPTLSY